MKTKNNNKQSDIAKWLGMSDGMLSHILNGRRRPSPESAEDLAKITGIDFWSWLMLPIDELKRRIYLAYEINKDDEGEL